MTEDKVMPQIQVPGAVGPQAEYPAPPSTAPAQLQSMPLLTTARPGLAGRRHRPYYDPSVRNHKLWQVYSTDMPRTMMSPRFRENLRLTSPSVSRARAFEPPQSAPLRTQSGRKAGRPRASTQ